MQALLRPGDVAAVDALTYPGFKTAAEARGLELLAIPCSARGPDLEALAPERTVHVSGFSKNIATGLRVGHFLWLPLPEGVRADQVVARLLQASVAVSSAEPFSTSEQVPHALRLALGSLPLEQLQTALDKVRQTIDHFTY